MDDQLTQLYPLPSRQLPLEGAYLSHDLRRISEETDRVFVYSNFVQSLDGRIAIPRQDGAGLTVPKQVANERDWRLFQELAAQADLIISSGRYLREWAQGKAQEILEVDDPRFADLRDWRQERGLKPVPDIAIVSASLRFPIPDVLREAGREVVVFTTAGHEQQLLDDLRTELKHVYIAGDDVVEGKPMVAKLQELGYRTVYSAAGPKILHLLAKGGGLNRLYLTYTGRLLAGDPFATIANGPLFDPPVDFRLNSMYLDQAALEGLGQLFVCYEAVAG